MVTGAVTNSLLQDSSYSPEASPEKHHLSIQFGLQGLNAVVLDIDSNTYLCLETIPFAGGMTDADLPANFAKAIEQSKLLAQRYKSCDVTIVSSLATLVPDALHESDKLQQYLEFNFGKLPEGSANSDHINSLSIQNTYHIPTAAIELLTKKYPSIRIKHHSTVLIDTLLRQNRYDAGVAIYANVREGFVDVLALEGKTLKFYNSFPCQNNSDLVYFLLYVVEQLKLDTNTTPFTLVGDIKKKSDLHQYLEKYIANLEFGKRNWVFKMPYAFSSLEEQEHFVLLHQFLCA